MRFILSVVFERTVKFRITVDVVLEEYNNCKKVIAKRKRKGAGDPHASPLIRLWSTFVVHKISDILFGSREAFLDI